MSFNFTELPPLSLYVHIPWCVKKCPYCDFNSHTCEDPLPEYTFAQQLIKDLNQELVYVQDRKLQSIFFGGGTPSLLSGSFYITFMEELKHRIEFSPDIEITLEANPGTADSDHFSGYRHCGINRLSIGIQSFSDRQLELIGRIHNSDHAHSAIELAIDAGFSNINLDLMYGLPEQSISSSNKDISIATHKPVPHISWYNLTIEPNTEYYSRPPILPNENITFDMFEQGSELLNNEGYFSYEISAWSKTGMFSKHNENYWLFGDYIGIGPGAHSKLTSLDTQQVFRFQKTRKPSDYLSDSGYIRSGYKNITCEEIPLEVMMNLLRLYRPINTALVTSRSGLAFEYFEKALNTAEKKGFIRQENNELHTTSLGRLWLNDLLALF